MARYHSIDVSIWEWLQGRKKEEKLLYIYAFSNPLTRDSGLYRIGIDTILLNTGLNRRGFEGALKGLVGDLKYDFDNRIMFVVNKLKRRLSGIERNTNLIKSVYHDLEAFKNSPLIPVFKEKYSIFLKGLVSPSLPIPISISLQVYIETWNTTLNTKTRLTNARTLHLNTRIKEKEFTENFELICKKVKDSDFLMGKNPSQKHKNWKATFDWIIKNEDNYTKVLEGNYDNGEQGNSKWNTL